MACVQISKHAKLDRKEVDDVLGGEEAWKNAQKTDGRRACGYFSRSTSHGAGMGVESTETSNQQQRCLKIPWP